MITKNWWKKLPLDEKIITILFFSGFIFLLLGLIMLLSIKIDIFNGFNFIYINGVIDSLTYQSSQGITVDIFFLKVGIIFTIFLMPICSGCSIIWFIIKRLIFKK
ncbi:MULTISPECIES: hypothetical protein [Spiroplasma]|uniref:Uncharacterized protein n=1 Tax=Spiroplasma ixodetis TaxID=2141 RepID=A0ABN6T668_9MOLU|nr:hypothetical protein [Spiroplasma ixodetis]WDA54119.1 MAG: hypothetical protein PPFGHCPK_00546 [Spiroplasma endosymbiont of Drosophila atripex]BDT04600.1 hypothetical protein SHM_22460 [Spiroplasma ixodetis]